MTFLFFLNKIYKFVNFFLIRSFCRVHLISHLRNHHLRHSLTHNNIITIALKNFFVRMNIFMTIAAACIDNIAMLTAIRQNRLFSVIISAQI